MRQLLLVLNSPTGDEFGRLLVPGVKFPPAGQSSGGTGRPDAEPLYEAIQAALVSEGLKVLLEPMDFRLAVCRSLVLEDGSSEEVRVALPVQVAGVDDDPPLPNGGESGALDDFPASNDADGGEQDADLEDLQEDEDE